jgi:uncharacterized membrane protein
MRNGTTFLLTAGLGAAAMYFLDPARGRYRRALVRDRFVHAGHTTRHGIGVLRRDVQNRAVGKTASVLSIFRAAPPDARVLAERVRACLGRVVTHSSSIRVDVRDGVVTLSGPILEEEVGPLIETVRDVQGVEEVRNELEVHAEPGRVPGLQGSPRRSLGERSAFLKENWPPATRAVAGVAGATAAVIGFNRSSVPRLFLGTAGLVLLGRAVTNLGVRRLVGVGALPYVVAVQKNLRINAPVEQVFRLWDDCESFPSFMTHVRRVRRLRGEGANADRWRWTVDGPSGLELEFDVRLNAREENRLLAWRTERGALVQHEGSVQFHPNDDGSTTVDIKMVYSPVGGALGHAVARLLGVDPKHRMDDDLLRMKSFLETGKTPRHAAEHAA